MYITHEDFTDQPLLIKQGALLLWGAPLVGWIDHGQTHHLYQLNDFYADMRYHEHTGQLSDIVTSTDLSTLAPDLNQLAHRVLVGTNTIG